MRLENWQEGGYRVDDQPNARGEMIIGSSTVCAGYYKDKEATDEAFFEENGTRWWRSGDIGRATIVLENSVLLNVKEFEWSEHPI